MSLMPLLLLGIILYVIVAIHLSFFLIKCPPDFSSCLQLPSVVLVLWVHWCSSAVNTEQITHQSNIFNWYYPLSKHCRLYSVSFFFFFGIYQMYLSFIKKPVFSIWPYIASGLSCFCHVNFRRTEMSLATSSVSNAKVNQFIRANQPNKWFQLIIIFEHNWICVESWKCRGEWGY